MSLSFIYVGVLALVLVVPAVTCTYVLDPNDNYSGASFFDKWDFITDNDPTLGFVNYLSHAEASSLGHILYDSSTGRNLIGVDASTVIASTFQTPQNRGRDSVRIESKKTYTQGLFIADFAHIPEPACGIWPAFWTVSHTNYPEWGEIDMLENINEVQYTLNALHTARNVVTGSGCTIAGNQGATRMSSNVVSYNCDDSATTGPFGTSQSVTQGCASNNPDPNAYGTAFNARGGGIIAMEWTTSAIRIWDFSPSAIPFSLAIGAPDPDRDFGLPSFTTVGGECTIPEHFANHNIVLNTAFCGTYAGQDYFWQQTSCARSGWATCNAYVAANPSAFNRTYWAINSVKVYQPKL